MAGTGAQWPGHYPGAGDEDVTELQLVEVGSNPTIVGAIRNVSGSIIARDSAGIFDMRSAGGGITEAQHESLDSLVHDIAEDAYTELTRSGGKVTDVVIWTDSGKTIKIREYNITRSAGKVSQIVAKQYDGAGDLKTDQTLTTTITRTVGKVSSLTSVES